VIKREKAPHPGADLPPRAEPWVAQNGPVPYLLGFGCWRRRQRAPFHSKSSLCTSTSPAQELCLQ